MFDGVMPHIAGAGRADFNTRFSQAVGLDQFGALKFPFTDAPQTRSRSTGRTDGLLGEVRRRISQPKIIYTNSSVEYWGTGRAAALVHTSIDGKTRSDAAGERARRITSPARSTARRRFRRERSWAMARTPRRRRSSCRIRRRTRSACARCVLALDRWVRDGVEPPASKYPRLSDGTLTPVANLKWPALNGVASPKTIPEPRRASGRRPGRRVAIPRAAGR